MSKLELAIMAALILFFYSGSSAICLKSNDSFELEMNGLTWLNYGPAIIHSAKSVVLIDYGDKKSPSRRYEIGEKDKNFAKVIGKIAHIYEDKLNYSPKDPSFQVGVVDYVYLFSTPVPPKRERGDNGCPLIWQHGLKNKDLISSYLLGIPLGVHIRSPKQGLSDKNELTSLMHLDKGPKPEEEGRFGGEYIPFKKSSPH